VSWVRVDDGFDEHPKIDALGDAAFRLHVAALCYCARTLSDGHVPAAKAGRLTATARPKVIAELVAAGVWEAVTDGYVIHDYLDYQLSREKVLNEREKTRARVARHRERSSNGVTRAATNDGGTDAPSHPDPSTELSSSNDSTPATPEPGEDERITRTIRAVAERRCARAQGVQRPGAWTTAAERSLRIDEDAANRCAQMIAEYPSITDGQLIDALDGNTTVLRFLQRREVG
jgi:hypothetical protein